MYDTCVGVRGVRNGKTISGSYSACVFYVGLMDPIGDVDATSYRGAVRILIPRSGENAWLCGRPQIGDVVTLPEDNKKYRVSYVSSPMGADWEMEAREA